jgi:hypothetical protein
MFDLNFSKYGDLLAFTTFDQLIRMCRRKSNATASSTGQKFAFADD